MEDKTPEELEAEFEATLEGLSDEEKSQKIAEREVEREDVDHKKELERLEAEKKPNEFEKAQRALHFNAERFKELGGDPSEVLGVKPKEKENDLDAVVDRKFAERDARNLSKSDDEFNLIMWYVRNRGLSVSEAHLLANKDKIIRQSSERERANVDISKGGGAGRKVETQTVPSRTPEEVSILERRGMRFNPQTKTFQGKFYEEFWDGSMWTSRKLKK